MKSEMEQAVLLVSGACLTQGTQLSGCYMGRIGRGLLPKSNSCRPQGMMDSVESSWMFYLCLSTGDWL